MTLDPRVSVWLNVVIGILTALIGGTAYWDALFSAHTTAEILAVLSLTLLALNAVLHMIPSPPKS